MSITIQNEKEFLEKSSKDIYIILVTLLPKLNTLADIKIEEAYTSTFGRNPIDTGQSKENTFFSSQAHLRPTPLINAIFESKKQFPFLYFANPQSPKNPNFKYGKRNTVISARDKLAKQLGIN